MKLEDMVWYVNYKEFSSSWNCWVHRTQWFKTGDAAFEFATTVFTTQIAKYSKE